MSTVLCELNNLQKQSTRVYYWLVSKKIEKSKNKMGYDSGYKPGKYEAAGWDVLVINIICIILTFFILCDDMVKAMLVLFLQIVAAAVTSMLFLSGGSC